MRETLSKRQKGKVKKKVAVARASSKPVSKKKKELKKKETCFFPNGFQVETA